MRNRCGDPLAVLRSASAPASFCSEIMPQDFLPPDDQGQLNASIQAANGTSYRADGGLWPAGQQNRPCRSQHRRRHAGCELQRRRRQFRQSQHHAQAAGAPAQAAGGPGGRGVAPQGHQHARHQRLRHLSRRPSNIGGRSSRSTYQYTLQGLDLAQLQDVSTQLETELKDRARICRRQQRFRQGRRRRRKFISTATAPRRWASVPRRSRMRWAMPLAASRSRRSWIPRTSIR